MVRECVPKAEFTAIFATSSLHAAGAIRACQTLGLMVPESIPVLCFEDSFMARYFPPPITAVDLNIFWLGHRTGKLLLRAIEGENPGSSVLLPGKPVVRDSTAVPKERG